MRRRLFIGGIGGLILPGTARTEDEWMIVRLGGRRYRLLRALDDGASDRPDPSGNPQETILLRADLPDIAPHVPKEELDGRSPLLGSMIEILGESVAGAPDLQKTITPEAEWRRLQVYLIALFTVHVSGGLPPLDLVSVPNDVDVSAPRGPDMKIVRSPRPWNVSYEGVFINGDPSHPTDFMVRGGGETIQWFLHNSAVFKVTYGSQFGPDWKVIHANIAVLFDRSEIS